MPLSKQFLKSVEFNQKENFLLFPVNPRVFSIQTVFSAAYVLLDKAFVLVDGQPDSLLVVSLMPKKGRNLKGLAVEFSEQLLNYAVNSEQSRQTKGFREELIKRVFLTHTAGRGEKP